MGHVSGAWFTRAGFNHLINPDDLGLNTQLTNQIAFPHSPGQGEAGPRCSVCDGEPRVETAGSLYRSALTLKLLRSREMNVHLSGRVKNEAF